MITFLLPKGIFRKPFMRACCAQTQVLFLQKCLLFSLYFLQIKLWNESYGLNICWDIHCLSSSANIKISLYNSIYTYIFTKLSLVLCIFTMHFLWHRLYKFFDIHESPLNMCISAFYQFQENSWTFIFSSIDSDTPYIASLSAASIKY